jgi:hypothetical protein
VPVSKALLLLLNLIAPHCARSHLSAEMTSDEIQDIEQRIISLEMELVALRKQRNALVPFHRLPAEVVLCIFRFAKESKRDPDDLLQDIFYSSSKFITPSRDEFDLTWVYLMSTCARLREIALASCELWQSEGIQVPGSPQWRDLCLQRKQSLDPLFLHCTTSDDCCEEKARIVRNTLMALATTHLPLVTEAHLVISTSTVLDETEQKSEQTLLRVLSQTCDYLKYLRISWKHFTLHSDVLGGASHSITTLVLSDVQFFETWPRFTCLCNLMISYHSSHDSRAHRHNLLTWLASLDTIEVLAIQSNYYYRDTYEEVPQDDELPKFIILPRLRILRIKDSSFDVLTLLQALSEPRHGLDVTIEWDNHQNDNTSIENFISKYSAEYINVIERLVHFWNRHRLQSQSPALIGAVKIIAPDEYNSYLLSGEGTTISLCSTPYGLYLDISKPFCRFSGPCHVFDTLPLLCNNLINMLILSENYHCSMGLVNLYHWRMLLEHLKVETVYLEDPNDYCHMSARMPDQDLPNESKDYLLINWLRVQKLNGRPLRKLQVGKFTNMEAQAAMRVMATELKNEQIVENIEGIELIE